MTISAIDSPENFAHLSHPKYRADIDGLRAISVLAVVGFHLFPNWIRGGFIGVDVFFAISGFLISTIIFESLQRKSFCFWEFYGRRIRRIFPALLLVLVASYAFGWFTLLADEYKQLGKHIAGGAGFISNFVLWQEAGYFDSVAGSKPLLHLWSLGIEEQFYIIWPLLLWGAWKKRLNLLAITVAVAAASFFLNIKGVHADAIAEFYSPQTRFWELLIGSALAWITLYKRGVYSEPARNSWLGRMICAQVPGNNGVKLRDIQALVGAAIIAAGVVLISKEQRFPGWWGVFPVSGAVLIISAGAHAWFNRAILSSRVLVWFGLISFPLYLWHWPVIVFARIVAGGVLSLQTKLWIIAISIVLAWLTYRFIEVPIRFNSNNKLKTVVLLGSCQLFGCKLSPGPMALYAVANS